MKKLISELKKQILLKEDVVLTTIVASSGSTPRGLGARMLVGAKGRLCGTVGGGAVEHEAERIAVQTLKEKASCVRSFELSPNQVADLGMICGGAVTLYFQYIDAKDNSLRDVADYALDKIQKGETSWLITETTEGINGKISIYTEKDGFYNMANPPKELLQLMTGHNIQKTIEGKSYYVEQLVHAGSVYVFGGGHVAQELIPALSHVGFRCVLLDDREDFVSSKLFPDAQQTLLVDFNDIGKTINITENDYVAIMTRGHQHDTTVQAYALRTEACYIGVMGSAQKKKAVAARIAEMGFEQKDIDRIKTPIGLNIKAETPAEIAVSIASELILKRAERNGL